MVRTVGLLIVLWLVGGLPSRAADSATKARLVLSADAARPGDTVWAGVHLTMAPRWHVYWRNPGESGVATSIEWTLPPGVKAGEIHWPPPESFTAGDMTTFVYHREAMLLVPLTLSGNVSAGAIDIKAKVSWLECEVACVPGDAATSARLTIGAESKPSTAAPQIEAWKSRIPSPNPTLQTKASWSSPPVGDTGELLIQGQVADGFVPTDFLPYASDQLEVGIPVKALPGAAGEFRLGKTIKRLEKQFPATMAGLLIAPGPKPEATRAFEVTLALPGGKADSSGRAATIASTPAPAAAAAGLIWKMLGLAFLGGLILNVMPCVLPVIALKIFGFVQQSKEAPRRVRQLGLLYGLGVLVSFLVLAGLVIAVQAAGDSASWGMQMQNPYFRLVLTVVVALVALNLFGVFEVTLGGGALGAAAGWASKEGNAGAFFNGVLATALATPCTAPFLTVALGFAFTQPAVVIVLMFASTALGLAAPYVLLSWQPGWLKFLPKPGAWMERFKVAMGFPMLATAVWLFDLTASGYGEGGILWVGLFLVVVALAAWVWGEFVQRGQQRRGLAAAIALLLVGTAYGVALESQLDWRHPNATTPGQDIVKDSPDGIEWHRWSTASVEQARAAGQPVLVDFTAKWCLTCKTNKRFAIDIPEVRAKLKQLGGIAFRADYTNKDALIAAELKRYQRAGVPLVLLFPRRGTEPAIVLPAALTPGIVLEALDQAGR